MYRKTAGVIVLSLALFVLSILHISAQDSSGGTITVNIYIGSVAPGNLSMDSWVFTTNIPGSNQIQTTNGQVNFPVPDGSGYFITEPMPTGYTFGSVKCIDNKTQGLVGTPSGQIITVSMTGDDITCNFINNPLTETLTIKEVLIPSDDSGRFNLKIDNTPHVTDVGNNGTTGSQKVIVGPHTISEEAFNSSTILGDYNVSFGGDPGCNSDGTITLAAGDNKICTITNTANGPTSVVENASPNDSRDNGSTTNGGSGGGGSSPPVCNDTKPDSAPTLLSAIAGVNSVALKWSKAANPVSYYLVTYGLSSGTQQFGNPNVGGSDTTTYTVSGLSGGARYYFKVRAGNGCTPGNYSNELSAVPTGVKVGGLPTGFTPGVLGQETSATPSPGPEVLGATQGASTNPGFLNWVLTHKKISGGIALSLFAAAYGLYHLSKKNK
jgi:hypothetical protein